MQHTTILNTGEWQGSEKTADMVRKQIELRYGKEAGEAYNPLKNCFTYQTWLNKGYQVKRGEKAIKSMSVLKIAKLDKKGKAIEGEEVTKRRLVSLFYISQVQPIKN